MDINQLEHLVALVEEGSVRAAATRHHISQPGLSMSIKRLEAELNTPLFERVGRRIQATQDGIDFCERAKLALAQLRIGRAALKDSESVTVRLGIGRTRDSGFIGRLCEALARCFPGITLDIVEDNYQRLLPKVINGQLDAAFVGTPHGGIPDSLEFVTLGRTSMSIVCRPTHPLATKRNLIRAEELRSASWLTSKSAPQLNLPIDHLNRRLTVDSAQTIKEVLPHIDYLAVLPDVVIKQELTNGTLVKLNSNVNLDITVIAVRRTDFRSKVLDTAFDIARSCFDADRSPIVP